VNFCIRDQYDATKLLPVTILMTGCDTGSYTTISATKPLLL